MSLAFRVRRLKIKAVKGVLMDGLLPGTFWRTGNILFRAGETAGSIMKNKREWARAVDEEGREYLLWKLNSGTPERIAVQAWDSLYCFELDSPETL